MGNFFLNFALGLQFWMVVELEVLDYIIYRQRKKEIRAAAGLTAQ